MLSLELGTKHLGCCSESLIEEEAEPTIKAVSSKIPKEYSAGHPFVHTHVIPLKSRALAWLWRVWVNTPTGMAGLIREQRLDDTRVPVPVSGISVSVAGPLNAIL